jgi:uncharacterized protein (TIGR03435 family)
MRARAVITMAALVALLPGPSFAQSPAAPPAFDVADVHVSAHSANPAVSGGALRAGRYELHRATMVDLIRNAYGVEADNVLGGPSWLETDRFDVVAKAPANTSPDALKLMLQALLADRFKLVVHQDSKPIASYALTAGKGKPKLTEAAASGNPGCQGQPQTPQPGVIPYTAVSCHNLTMTVFAQFLRGMAGAYVTTPIADMTGLTGSWDFDLKWTPRALLAQAGADGISIFDAVDKQLGLKLEMQNVSTPAIIVDSVNEKPADNPPGVAAALPPAPPPEFEVADVKPTAPGVTQQVGRIQNDRLDFQAFPLRDLIMLAWNLTGEDLLANAPAWLASARFDILAKVSTGGLGTGPQIDIDTLRLMFRALLMDRFKLATHTEDRPVSAYVLTAAKPKLTKADPLSRTNCKEGPAPAAKDPREANPILSRLVTCRNMTMAQFADRLQGLAAGYIHAPVADATGLDGAWDFSFNFSPIGIAQGGGPGRGGDAGAGAAAGGALTASDPTGALSLLDAMTKQLGLKLEMQKRPLPVLVIDHVEQKPTD